jgi:membrane-associated phospholipid phosphatase
MTTWQMRSQERRPEISERRARVLLVWVMIAVGVFEALWFAVVVHGGVTGLDPGVVSWLAAHRGAGLVTAATVVTDVGSPTVMVSVTVGALLRWARRRDRARAGLGAVGLGGLLGLDVAAKVLVARPRPPVPFEAVAAHGYSFPSGHAMVSLGCVLIVAWLVRAPLASLTPAVRRTLAGTGTVVVAAVGSSRVVLGVHYPSDVLAGWALAVLVVAALGLLALALGRDDA